MTWTTPSPERVRLLWTLARAGAVTTAELWVLPTGWQIRMLVNGDVVATSAVAGCAAARAISDQWRAGLLTDGWITVRPQEAVGDDGPIRRP